MAGLASSGCWLRYVRRGRGVEVVRQVLLSRDLGQQLYYAIILVLDSRHTVGVCKGNIIVKCSRHLIFIKYILKAEFPQNYALLFVKWPSGI